MSEQPPSEQPPLVFIARRADGTPIAVVPADDPGNWNEPVKWCLIAIDGDKRARPA